MLKEDPSNVRKFASLVTGMASMYRSTTQPDRADEQMARALVAGMSALRNGATTELQAELAVLRNFRITWALETEATEKAQRMLHSELAEAREAYDLQPRDPANALRLTLALDTQLRLLEETASDEQQELRKKYLEFSFAQLRQHPTNTRLVEQILNGQFRAMRAWVSSDPLALEDYLQQWNNFVDSLDSTDPTLAAQIDNAHRFSEALNKDIRRWKEHAAAAARGVDALQQLGGHQLGSGTKFSWSPDGTKYVCGKLPLGAGLQIVDRQTGAVTDLVDFGKSPAWSPDGRFIAFAHAQPADSKRNEEVWLLELGQDQPQRLVDGGFPSWSHDAATLFVHSAKESSILSVDVGNLQATPRTFMPNVESYYFSVSPDEKKVALSNRDEFLITDRLTGKILQRWPLPGNFGVLPAWSPDGKRIAFGGYMNTRLGLWVLDVAGNRAVRVASGPFTMPAWSRDGKSLAFDQRMPSSSQIWMVETALLESLPTLSSEQVVALLNREAARYATHRPSRTLRHVDLTGLSEVGMPHDGWALAFNGESDFATGPHIPFDTYDTFTVEAWVRGWTGAILCQSKAGDQENGIWLSLGQSQEPHETCGWESSKGHTYQATVGVGQAVNWNHVALVFDGQQQWVFLNGKLLRSAPATRPGKLDKTRRLTIGAHQYSTLRYGTGMLGSVRISKVARYQQPFVPAWQLTADADTVLLYDLAAGKGKQLLDASGNEQHAQLQRPSWMKANQLYSLDLSATDVVDADLVLLKSQKNLFRLNLSQTEISDAGLEHLGDLTSLRELRVGETRVTGDGLKFLTGLTKLKILGLTGTRITDHDLVHLGALTQLRRLRLIETPIDGSGLAHLQHLDQLQQLWLGSTRTTDAALEYIKAFTQLEGLGLKATQVTDAGLVNIEGCTKLKELNLSNTKITNAGLKHLRDMTDLELLYLWETRVTSHGLAQLEGLTGLTLLSLGNTRTSDTGLAHLHGLKKLETLYLTNAPVSTTGINKLRKAVPSLQKVEGVPR
jgi:hypothetical protein